MSDVMNSKMNMIYWKSEKFWLGKLLEHPEIMTQGETLEELEMNLRDIYLLMAMEDAPEQYDVKKIAVRREKSSLIDDQLLALIIVQSSRRLGRMPGPHARMSDVEPILRLAIHGTGFRHPAGMG